MQIPEDQEVYVGTLDGEMTVRIIPKHLAPTLTMEDIAHAAVFRLFSLSFWFGWTLACGFCGGLFLLAWLVRR